MHPVNLLITGFGPFPGVAENVSGWLVDTLAATGLAARLGCALRTEVLPTEWSQVALLGPALLRQYRPRLILHLGVSRRAQGFRIERAAHNRVAARHDAQGALPARRQILDHGHVRLDTTLPVPSLAKHLRQHGLPAVTSSSAGSYLCNFLYYHSLDWALRQKTPADVCFVHVPPATSQGGPLTEAELLYGAEAILGYLVAFADAQDRTVAASDRAARRPEGRSNAARR